MSVGWSNRQKGNIMKCLILTNKEVDTLLGCIQDHIIAKTAKIIKEGEFPSLNETIQILNGITKKLYTAIMEG